MLTKQQPKSSLCVVAICKNEEKDLPYFFANFSPWVDEIVIIDDNSSDASRDIIESTTGNIQLVSHLMDSELGFSGQRNLGIQHSTCDWILHTDIDERATPAFIREVLSILDNDEIHGCRYRRENFFLHRKMHGGGLQDWNKPQLARRGKHYFVNRIHEECIVEGAPDNIIQLNSPMLHINDESYIERMKKSMTYCIGQAEKMERNGYLIKWWHLILFPLGEFTRKYFFRKGFIDGVPGLIWCIHSACAMFRASALLWDKQNHIPREVLEKSISDGTSTIQHDRTPAV